LIGASERGPCGLNTRFAGSQCDDDKIALLPPHDGVRCAGGSTWQGAMRAGDEAGEQQPGRGVHGLGIELRREPLDLISIQDMRCDTLMKRLPLTSIMMIVILAA
jgi:hypothetical protein